MLQISLSSDLSKIRDFVIDLRIIFAYFETEIPEGSPPVSVGPSTLQTESSGVLEGSASVISKFELGCGRLLRCFALSAWKYCLVYILLKLYAKIVFHRKH